MFKFYQHYRHLLDEPKVVTEEKKNSKDKRDKKDKKNKKEKKTKEKKNKTKKGQIEPAQPVQEPAPEPKVTRYNIDWLKKSFEAVLAGLPPSDKFLSVDKEKIILRLWLFAEEEDLVRKMIVAQMIPDRTYNLYDSV